MTRYPRAQISPCSPSGTLSPPVTTSEIFTSTCGNASPTVSDLSSWVSAGLVCVMTGAGLGLSVDDAEPPRPPEGRLHRADEFGRDRRPAGYDHRTGREVAAREAGVVDHRDQHRRHSTDHVSVKAFRRIENRSRIEVLDQPMDILRCAAPRTRMPHPAVWNSGMADTTEPPRSGNRPLRLTKSALLTNPR